MALTGWIADTSALVRLSTSPDAQQWADRLERGLLSIAVVTRLEVGYSARSGDDLRSREQRSPLRQMPVLNQTPAIDNRALDVQRLLADRGRHRAPSVSDLLVAATAELSGLTVLHVDKDFELIAEVTGQPIERLATLP